MSINTAARRLSAMDFGSEMSGPGLVLPDATIAPADRESINWLYSGIAAASPPAPVISAQAWPVPMMLFPVL